MTDIKDLMKKIDYLVRINPAIIHPPLSQTGNPKLKYYQPLSKEEAKRELLKKPPKEIERLYNEVIANQISQNEDKEKKRYLNCDADFNYWGKQPYWTIDEGIILVLGKDPRKIQWNQVRPLVNISDFAKKFEEMRELANRYLKCGQLTDKVAPGVFLAWAQRIGNEIPEKLLNVVNALGIQIADWQMLYQKMERLLDEKDKLIEALRGQNERIVAAYEELKNNPFHMDEESNDYAPELDAANIIYRSVINNRDGSVSFKEQASILLEKRYSNLSIEARKRIAIVVNTQQGRLGGRTNKNE